jgi:hypothetical protein
MLFENVYKIRFKNSELTAITKNVGINYAGKEIAISSLSNQMSGHYLLCNCLNSNVYDRYILQLNEILNNVDQEQLPSPKFSPESDTIEIYFQRHSSGKFRIDEELIKSKVEDNFHIASYPLNKGLDLSEESISNGTTLIFTEGIGILKFIDFFAYLCRKLINNESPANSIFDNEVFDDCLQKASFIVYAYFPSKKESIGLELCTKISKLHKMFKADDVFKFTPMHIKMKDKKVDFETIKRLIYRHCYHRELKNIWVSGSPSMNSLFQKHKKRILNL